MTLLSLPVDIIESILHHLDARSLFQLSLTSWEFFKHTSNESLWQHLVIDDFNLPRDASFRQSGWRDLYSRLNASAVYTWGENSDGRLGHLNRQPRRIFNNTLRSVREPRELTTLSGKGIVDIVAGGWSFHALDRHGQVWMWGTMRQPQHDDFNSVAQSLGVQAVNEPTKVNLPSSLHVKSVSCGRSHAIALGRDGQVWHWNNHQCPQQIEFDSPSRIVQVTANWGYSSALSASGEVIVIPEPTLVMNADEPPERMTVSTVPFRCDMYEPHAVSSEARNQQDKFVQIAGMESCTLALTRFGRVFKLDTSAVDTLAASPADAITELKRYSAKVQELNERHKQMKRFISAQFRSFAVYTADGKVMLGHQDALPETEPKIESNLNSVCKVTFGDYHCGALTNQGQLLTWGNYSEGALGHGIQFAEPRLDTPTPVAAFENMVVFAAGFGGWHSGALAIPRKATDSQ